MRLKSKVNSYVLGAQKQMSVPITLSCNSRDVALEMEANANKSVATNPHWIRVLKKSIVVVVKVVDLS